MIFCLLTYIYNIENILYVNSLLKLYSCFFKKIYYLLPIYQFLIVMKLYIDEAGRWPLAWPMHIGIVLPLKKFDKTCFKDSKQLSEKQREQLFEKIEELQKDGKIRFTIWSVSNTEIDKLGMTKALNLAIRRGINQLFVILFKGGGPLAGEDFFWSKKYITKKDIDKQQKENNEKIELIIDGNNKFWLDKDLGIKVETVVKWDSKIKEISMASILAKVSRDRIMENEMDKKYPKYNFKKHKWYGTKEHRDLILKYGPCKIHRKLFLRKIMWEK